MPWTKLLADSYHHSQTMPHAVKKGGRVLTYGSAIKEALTQALRIDKRVFVMGEGVDDTGGVFGTTRNLHKRFGKERSFDLPLAENSFTGFAVGAALCGMRPVLVHMRMDFMPLSMDQILNHASKWRYMYGGKQFVPLTIRCIIGRGWGSGAQHSQSLEGLFMHIPGLRIVCPSNAYDAKGFLLASIADDDPVIFIEHRWLFNSSCPVPAKPYILPFGKAAVRRPGKDVTIIAYSLMVHEALEAARMLETHGIDAQVLDLRTLNPLDRESILDCVRGTGRVIVATLDWKTAGVSAEISALIHEGAYGFLKAPVQRIGLPDVPTPSSYALENEFYKGRDDIVQAALELCSRR